jgi:hypothetical protein
MSAVPAAAVALVAASAFIVLALGTAHLWLTFRSRAFHLRDAALEEKLQSAHCELTRETTMWRAWIGFNASHSQGAMLFGLVYGYLALAQRELLFGSLYLPALGLLMLLTYLLLAVRYWFSRPLLGIAAASVCYVAGFVWAWA